MSAYMIDSTIGPIPVVSDELIVTDRARKHLIDAGWTAPPSLVPDPPHQPSGSHLLEYLRAPTERVRP